MTVTPAALPEVRIDLTLQRLVMMSAANMDFAPTHIDDVAARASGAPAAYADMISIFAMVERFTRATIGPEDRILRLGPVRLMDFVVNGHEVVIRGVVASRRSTPPVDRVIDVEVCQNGTVRATASVEIVTGGGRDA